MSFVPQRMRLHVAIFLIAFSLLIAQFIFELGIVYGVSLISDVASSYLVASKIIFIVLHVLITLILIALAKRIGDKHYKETV